MRAHPVLGALGAGGGREREVLPLPLTGSRRKGLKKKVILGLVARRRRLTVRTRRRGERRKETSRAPWALFPGWSKAGAEAGLFFDWPIARVGGGTVF